jgi:hypothetical protein
MVRPPASRATRWATPSMPPGQSADDGDAAVGQVVGQSGGCLASIGGGPPSPDNRHRPLVGRQQGAFVIEDRGVGRESLSAREGNQGGAS